MLCASTLTKFRGLDGIGWRCQGLMRGGSDAVAVAVGCGISPVRHWPVAACAPPIYRSTVPWDGSICGVVA